MYPVNNESEQTLKKKEQECSSCFLFILDNIPIDNILRQLGIDPHSIQRSASFPSAGICCPCLNTVTIVTYVWRHNYILETTICSHPFIYSLLNTTSTNED